MPDTCRPHERVGWRRRRERRGEGGRRWPVGMGAARCSQALLCCFLVLYCAVVLRPAGYLLARLTAECAAEAEDRVVRSARAAQIIALRQFFSH
jgi:hypothetical protein